MNQPPIQRYDLEHPMSIGEMRLSNPTVIPEPVVSTPVLIAAGVAALIGVSALAAYLYQNKQEREHLAMNTPVTQPATTDAQSSSAPPPAPTVHDSPVTQLAEPVSKESSEAIEAVKSKNAAAAQSKAPARSAPPRAPATKPAPTPAPPPTIVPEPVKEPEQLKSEPPPAPPQKEGAQEKGDKAVAAPVPAQPEPAAPKAASDGNT